MSHRSNLPRVLIVDDDAITLRFFQGALSRMAECVIASDGAMALTCAKGGAFDLLVIDLNLPDMRGEQLLEKLQASHATSRQVRRSMPTFEKTLLRMGSTTSSKNRLRSIDCSRWSESISVRMSRLPYSMTMSR